MDFTCSKYRDLLLALQRAEYEFLTMEQYCDKRANNTLPPRFVIMRHDVDLRAQNSQRIAEIEHSLGVKASYYFRIVPESNQPDVIRAIAAMGHEVGYHYEDMSVVNGDVDKAYEHFQTALAYFRTYYPVRTVCMHGAPTSRYDGRDLWRKYDYRALGLVGEPYFDVDFDQVFYLTDTGRCWDGYRYSVRDKVPQQDRWIAEGRVFHTTNQLIQCFNAPINAQMVNDSMVNALMITTHPQRWTNNPLLWLREWVMQNVKNQIKRVLIWRSR